MTKYPTCGTCPFTQPAGEHEGKPIIWCHGAPPSAWTVGTQWFWAHPVKTEASTGCAKHPKWPRPRWWLFGAVW